MRFTVLGSGGNSPIPMPTCDCHICTEAREKGEPYARRGNSVFVHDENILIDTPELIWYSLNRESISTVDSIFITHFHADHTHGLRALQSIGGEQPPMSTFVGDVPTLYMSTATYERAIKASEFFELLTDQWADIELLDENETISLGNLDVTHIVAPEFEDGANVISGFLFESGNQTAFVSPDETRHFDLTQLPDLDLWVKECGYFSETPEGEPLVTDTAEQGILQHELTFQKSLDQIRTVTPERAVLTELEEFYRRSYDDYQHLEERYDNLNLEFAYDGMNIEI
ncbi:MBL fold metallo-hydrolase [Salinarchaeum sp. IM2453]|uniref:MBL fold metallo-hydrolase n=1 Tax=Salinarchaeum sp. IM2453 TaxID=2862870 RepID=UPI001C83774F|nr:MBL fold metallo-hydrolase [Salinarchaeum sp. IM2453]QZA87893.1 MBL fold metallo-hydrolase [Salinarchaeum sp. IM2453]